jgi:hypothetical protein
MPQGAKTVEMAGSYFEGVKESCMRAKSIVPPYERFGQASIVDRQLPWQVVAVAAVANGDVRKQICLGEQIKKDSDRDMPDE